MRHEEAHDLENKEFHRLMKGVDDKTRANVLQVMQNAGITPEDPEVIIAVLLANVIQAGVEVISALEAAKHTFKDLIDEKIFDLKFAAERAVEAVKRELTQQRESLARELTLQRNSLADKVTHEISKISPAIDHAVERRSDEALSKIQHTLAQMVIRERNETGIELTKRWVGGSLMIACLCMAAAYVFGHRAGKADVTPSDTITETGWSSTDDALVAQRFIKMNGIDLLTNCRMGQYEGYIEEIQGGKRCVLRTKDRKTIAFWVEKY